MRLTFPGIDFCNQRVLFSPKTLYKPSCAISLNHRLQKATDYYDYYDYYGYLEIIESKYSI